MWRNALYRVRWILPAAVVAFGVYVATSYFAQQSGSTGWVQSVAFSQDGRILVADAGIYLFVWDARTGELRCSVNYSPRYTAFTAGSKMSLARSGARVSVDSYSLGAVIIDTVSCDHVATLGAHSSSVPAHMAGAPSGASFLPDERYAAAIDMAGPYADDSPLHLYDTDTGDRIRSFQTDMASDIGKLFAVATSLDGTRVAAGGVGRIGQDVYGGLAIVWNLPSGQQLYHVIEPSARVDELSFSPDGEWLMVRSVDGLVRLWNTMLEEPVVLRTHCASVKATAFLPHGTALLVGCESDAVEACDTRSGTCEPTALPEVRGLNTLAVHPDGDRIAIGTQGGTISIFELPAGRLVREIDVPRSAPDTGQFGPGFPSTPPLEIFRTVLLVTGPVLWPASLIALHLWLRKRQAWLDPKSSPAHRTVYIGLRMGTWLTLGGLGLLVVACLPAGPWFLFFAIFPAAYGTPPVFMLTTAFGLIVGAVRNRDRLGGRQLAATFIVILVLISLGTASLMVALRWINEPK